MDLPSGKDRSTRASLENEVNSETGADLNLISGKAPQKPSETKLESALSTEPETQAQITTHSVNLDLGHEIDSGLDLGVGPGK